MSAVFAANDRAMRSSTAFSAPELASARAVSFPSGMEDCSGQGCKRSSCLLPIAWGSLRRSARDARARENRDRSRTSFRHRLRQAHTAALGAQQGSAGCSGVAAAREDTEHVRNGRAAFAHAESRRHGAWDAEPPVAAFVAVPGTPCRCTVSRRAIERIADAERLGPAACLEAIEWHRARIELIAANSRAMGEVPGTAST